MPPAAPNPKFARSRYARLYVIKTIGIILYQRDGAIVFVIVAGCINKDRDYNCNEQ
jgi:hypothetical protein